VESYYNASCLKVGMLIYLRLKGRRVYHQQQLIMGESKKYLLPSAYRRKGLLPWEKTKSTKVYLAEKKEKQERHRDTPEGRRSFRGKKLLLKIAEKAFVGSFRGKGGRKERVSL